MSNKESKFHDISSKMVDFISKLTELSFKLHKFSSKLNGFICKKQNWRLQFQIGSAQNSTLSTPKMEKIWWFLSKIRSFKTKFEHFSFRFQSLNHVITKFKRFLILNSVCFQNLGDFYTCGHTQFVQIQWQWEETVTEICIEQWRALSNLTIGDLVRSLTISCIQLIFSDPLFSVDTIKVLSPGESQRTNHLLPTKAKNYRQSIWCELVSNHLIWNASIDVVLKTKIESNERERGREKDRDKSQQLHE